MAKNKITDTDKSDKKSSESNLEAALQSITKSFGEGSIMRFGSAQATQQVSVIPSGAVSMDCAFGVGGWPRGRIAEIYGPESSGKTTLVLHAIAQVQAAGGVAALIDAEHAFDPKYAKNLGVNLDELLISQPDSGEEALTIAEILAKSKVVDLIAVDSVAALVPKAELEGEMGMATMGMQARLMSQALRKLTAVVHKSNTLCIFVNQLREKVGVMFGSPETTPGGKALKFYASVRIDVRKRDVIKDAAGLAMGTHIRVKIVKNKVAPPFSEAEFDIMFGKGINRNLDIIETALAAEIISKKGAWFQYEGKLIGQGKDAAAAALGENKELSDKLVKGIMDKRVHHVAVAEVAEVPEVPENLESPEAE